MYWLRIGYVLVTYWLRIGYVLVTYWLRIGYVLVTYWLRIGYVLVTYWLRIGYVLVTYWLRKARTYNSKSYKISKTVKLFVKCLHAFSVNNAGTRLVILLPGDPHLLEGGERSQDGSSNPDGVFPLRRSNDLDLHCGRRKGCYLFLHSISHSWEHCSTSRQYNV